MAASVALLEKVKSIRKHAVDECEARVRELERARAELEGLLVRERDAYLSERNDLNAAVAQGRVGEVNLFDRSLERRKVRMMETLQGLRDVKADLDVAEQVLVQARRQLRVVEILIEKNLEAARRETEKKEQRMLDDIATARFFRRQQNAAQEE